LTTIKVKLLIYETLKAQRDFTRFLRTAAQRYGPLLNAEESEEAAMLMQRASETIDRLDKILENSDALTISSTIEDKLPASDESYRSKKSNDKLPEPDSTPW